jgi:hypothetical protein
VGQFLAGDLVRDAFQQLAERRQWSWLQKHACWFPPTYNQTDSVTVTSNLFIVTSTGSQFVPAMVGNQIRVGGNQSTFPTYTIAAWLSSNTILLDSPWIGPTRAGQQYMVFQCYFPVPADFQSFYSLVNPSVNMRLWTNITQSQLDTADAQRVVAGPSFGAAFYDYTASYSGVIAAVQPVNATGASPVSTTSLGYSYPINSIYSVLITAGGSPGDTVLAFEWKQDSGTFSLPIVVTDNNAIDLSNGVQLYFPSGVYVTGDTFVIQCQSIVQPALPRYELWPRPINTPYAYPYLYMAKLPALTDAQPALPPFVAQRGDVLLEMALGAAAQFPGTATTRNPYYDLNLAKMHMIMAERLINELEVKDDNTATKDLNYLNMDYAPTPWLDGSYLQSHAWPYATW